MRQTIALAAARAAALVAAPAAVERISTKLGNGGPRVRARTTNGSVRVREIR